MDRLSASLGRDTVRISSSGKSTLEQALLPELEPQFYSYASDQLADGGCRPLNKVVRFAWRETFFEGFHRSIPTFASVGLDLVVEHILEEEHWAEQLQVFAGTL